MAAPLDGIRVLEVANWLAVPAATALMADLGAEVIKVEPPGTGDIFRYFALKSMGYDFDFPTNYAFQLDNRGKQSITVGLDRPGGPELVQELAATCDIFVTNLIQERRVKYGLTVEDIHGVAPKSVYVSFSGYGTRGPDAARSGFDFAAFWAASGIMGLMAEPDAPPPLCRGGQGDHSTSLNILAATLAALRMRDLTGEGQHVETTLQASGMWTIAGDYAAALASHKDAPRISRKSPTNPIWNSYLCADGEWILLVMPVPFPLYWGRFCEMVERPDWAAQYTDLTALRADTTPLASALDEIFIEKHRALWMEKMDAFGLIWAPVARVSEVASSAQVKEMGWITSLEHPQFGQFETLDTPFKLYGSNVGARGHAPDAGEHTFEILAKLGIGEERLGDLASNGVLG
jgi:crotonobetainyl-CoA:carnitine CoA-transferase CaiB-like acyl-CoA transferase